jgi:hypothetical protein
MEDVEQPGTVDQEPRPTRELHAHDKPVVLGAPQLHRLGRQSGLPRVAVKPEATEDREAVR